MIISPRALERSWKLRSFEKAVYNALYRCWKEGVVLRTKKPLYKYERIFKGRGGMSGTTRPYHIYVLRPKGRDSLSMDGHEFVKYGKKFLDARGGGSESKAKMILDHLRQNGNRAWFSREVAEALKDRGVKVRDVMSNVRRFERAGMIYVRGYKTDDRQTPFRKGFLLCWLDPEKPREEASEKLHFNKSKIVLRNT